jgi:hypothetical protein
MYTALKREVEKGAPEVQGINKLMSKIIPIRNAASNAAEIAKNNRKFSAQDLIGLGLMLLNPKVIAGIIPVAISRAQKSGTVARKLYKFSQSSLEYPKLTAASKAGNVSASANRIFGTEDQNK